MYYQKSITVFIQVFKIKFFEERFTKSDTLFLNTFYDGNRKLYVVKLLTGNLETKHFILFKFFPHFRRR